MATTAGHRQRLRIFISYRRQDTPAHAGRLYDRLAERFGPDDVFMDVDAIGPGTDFTKAIEDALTQCDVLLAVMGRTWLASTRPNGARRLDDPTDYVRRELEEALRRGIPVVPLLVQDASMPAATDLPASLAGLVLRQSFTVSDTRWGGDVAQLISELEAIGRPVAATPPASPLPPSPGAGRQRRWAIGLTAGVVVAVVALVAIVRLGSGQGRPLSKPEAVIAAADGTVLVSDTGNQRIRKVLPDGTLQSYAGPGVGLEHYGDGQPATRAEFAAPRGLATSGGTVYVADHFHSTVRAIDARGTITTVAGDGQAGFNGDDVAATTAILHSPAAVAATQNGTLYIADQKNNRIRKVDHGVITTVAGDGQPRFGGDDGPARAASVNEPQGLALGDGDKALYIADTGNHRIRKVDLSTGIIVTVAGDGDARFSGEGVGATRASLNGPLGVAVTADDTLYIADTRNNRVRKVVGGGITTYAGTGSSAFGGDGGNAAGAALAQPAGVAVGASGTVYIADTGNNRVRAVDAGGTIRTLV